MNPDSRLKRGIVRGLSLLFPIAFLVSCNLVNPFSSSAVPTSTRAPGSGPVTITAANVSRLVEAWSHTIGGTVRFSTAPTVADGMIYIGSVDYHTDGSETGTLYALDATSGNERWSYKAGGTRTFSWAPTVASGVVYIGSEDVLEALDAKTGIRLWSHRAGGTSGFSWAPTVANGVVYIGSEDVLEALDAKTDTRLWSYRAGGTSGFSWAPTVANGVVYIGSADALSASKGVLEALDAKTGTRLWSYRAGGTRTFSGALTVAASGVVYITSADVGGASENDMLEALDARTGIRLWSYRAGGTRTFSGAPTVANGVVYIGSEDVGVDGYPENAMLEALDARTGTRLWSYRAGGTRTFSGAPTVANGVGGTSGFLFAPTVANGVGGTSGFLFAPTVANGVVYIGWADVKSGGVVKNMLYALSAASGTKVWSYDMGSEVTAQTYSDDSLAITNGVVYIGSSLYGKLFALDAKSGTKLWTYFTAGSLESLPTATNNMIYANSLKTLYAFGLAMRATTPTATPAPSNGTQHLVPSINKAPVFADISGLHIQSTEGLQCPLSKTRPLSQNNFPWPADDLVFTTNRLTYSKDEIQQIRNYLHEMLYGSESTAKAYSITPPPTLHWVSGSDVCTLNLEISNSGNTTVQISSLGVQFTSKPQPNSSQQLHTLDFCSVAPRDCPGGQGGGDVCSGYVVGIALQVAPASSIFAETPKTGYGGVPCPEPILHPNDTLEFAIQLTSPGTKPDTVASYLYAVAPVLTVTGANGSRTFTLSSMAGIAAFVDRQQITCYGLQHDQDTTFVPEGPPSPYDSCLA